MAIDSSLANELKSSLKIGSCPQLLTVKEQIDSARMARKIVVFIVVDGLFKHLEAVALELEPLDAEGEGGAQLVDGLQGVVEGDDAARAGVAADVVEYVVGGEPLGVVAGDDVPHDDLELAAEQGILGNAHPAVRRAEEVGVDVGVGLLDVVAVLVERVAYAADVVVGVVAYLVALVDDALVEFGVLAHVVADHEECGVDAVLAQCVEDEWRSLRDWTVIEGQID